MSSIARKMRRDAMRKTAKMDTSARDAVVKLAQGQQTFQAQADNLVSDMNRHFRAEQKRIENNINVASLAAFSWILHDKWGWGYKRLSRLNKQIRKLIDDLKFSGLCINDVIEQLAKETKLEIEYGGKTPFIFGGEPVVNEMLTAQLERIEKEKAAGDGETSSTANAGM